MVQEDILAEIEDVLRTMPDRRTMHHETDDNLAWLGRTVAAITRWNSVQGIAAKSHARQLHRYDASEMREGANGLIMLLREAQSD